MSRVDRPADHLDRRPYLLFRGQRMPSQDRLLQGGVIGQLAGSVIQRRGPGAVDIDLEIVGHCHSSSARALPAAIGPSGADAPHPQTKRSSRGKPTIGHFLATIDDSPTGHWRENKKGCRKMGIQTETVIEFAPAARSAGADGVNQLDQAGQMILELLHKAAGVAEANSQRAIDMAQKISHELRAAEDRIAELEAEVGMYRERSERAEQWLHTVYTEIENRFLRQDDGARGAPQRKQGVRVSR
jgi:hypothetical protein